MPRHRNRSSATGRCHSFRFLVIFLWAWRLHPRRDLRQARGAILAGFMGGTLGGMRVLLMATVDQIDLAGL